MTIHSHYLLQSLETRNMFIDLKCFKQYFLCSNEIPLEEKSEFALCGVVSEVGGGGNCGEKEILYIKNCCFSILGPLTQEEGFGFIKLKQFLPLDQAIVALITIGLALGPETQSRFGISNISIIWAYIRQILWSHPSPN